MPDLFDLYLASGSPRRAELLSQIGVRYQRLGSEVDETPLPDELPLAYVRRITAAKAHAGVQLAVEQKPVLAADTSVVVDDCILGKPVDEAHACAMLQRLSGREHQVFTSVVVATATKLEQQTQISTVRFRALGSAEIAAYWASGEPADKAGAYAVQGFAATFIEHLQGSYSGVMGLPLFETAQLLRQFQIPLGAV